MESHPPTLNRLIQAGCVYYPHLTRLNINYDQVEYTMVVIVLKTLLT